MATATVTLGVNASPLVSGLAAAQSRIRGFGASAVADLKGFGTGFGGLVTGGLAGLTTLLSGRAFIGGIQNSIKLGGELHNLSLSSGVAVGQLAKLRGIFAESDKSGEELGSTLARMNRFIAETEDGSKGGNETLQKLGIQLGNIISLEPSRQFQELARGILAIPDPANRAAAAMQIFGKNGASLMPVFEDIKDIDLSKLNALATLLQKNAQRFDEVGDSIERARRKKDEFFAGFTSAILEDIAGGAGKVESLDAVGKGQSTGATFSDRIKMLLGKNPEGTKRELGEFMRGGRETLTDALLHPFGLFGGKPRIQTPLAAPSEVPEMPVDASAGDPWAAFRKFNTFNEPDYSKGPANWGPTNMMSTEGFLKRFHPEMGGELPPIGEGGPLHIGGGGQMNKAYNQSGNIWRPGSRWNPDGGKAQPATKSDFDEIMKKYWGGD